MITRKMTSKPRWGYKRSAMVLRPWIVQLLVRGDLKQRAQKVQVLQNVRGPRRSDGSVMKELTDGQAYIKAIFTAEAMKDYHDKCQDESTPPSINDALLILNDYHIEFLPHECCHWSEFVVEVKRFTLWSYQEGFGLKQSPVNSMDNEDVKKKAVALWKQWRETQGKGGTLDSSMSSLPLSQLLEEMGMVSDSPDLEEEEVQPQSQDALQVPRNPHPTSTSGRKWPTLDDYDEDCGIEDFIIPELEEKILAAIPEWQPDYQPEPTPTSDSWKSSGNVSEYQSTPRATLRKDCGGPSEQKSKEARPQNGIMKKVVDNRTEIQNKNVSLINLEEKQFICCFQCGEAIVTAVDAEIQVSQSLWEDFQRTARNSLKDATTQACSQGVPKSQPQTHQADTSGGHATTPDPQAQVTEVQTETSCGISSLTKQPESSETSVVKVLESTPDGSHNRSRSIRNSPCLLSSPEEPGSCEKPNNTRKPNNIADDEPVVIDDSFTEDKSDRSKDNKESKVRTEKDENDNDSPVIVDISSSQEPSPEALECMSYRQSHLEQNKLSADKRKPLGANRRTPQAKDTTLHVDMFSAVRCEEQEEEDRLHQLRKCSRPNEASFSDRSGIGRSSRHNSMLQRGKSLNVIADVPSSPSDRSGSKRRLSSSDLENSRSKKVFVCEQKITNEPSRVSVNPNNGVVHLDKMKTSANRSTAESTVRDSEMEQDSPVRVEQFSEDSVVTMVMAKQKECDTTEKIRLQVESSSAANFDTTHSHGFQPSTGTVNGNQALRASELTLSLSCAEAPNKYDRVTDRDSVVPSGQSDQLDTNSFLNDAQVVSSDDPITSSGEQVLSSGEQAVNEQTSADHSETATVVASCARQSPTRQTTVATHTQSQKTVTAPSYSVLSNQPPPDVAYSDVSHPTTPSHSLPSYQPPPHGTHSVLSRPTTPIHSLSSYQPAPDVIHSDVSHQSTPGHSLPSYQPAPCGTRSSPRTTPVHSLPSPLQQSACTSKTLVSPRRKKSFDQTFWGLLDSPHVSPEGKRLLEMTLSDGLMKKIEAYLSQI